MEKQPLESNLGETVRSDEITLKEKRDLGSVNVPLAGHQDIPKPSGVDVRDKGKRIANSDDADALAEDEEAKHGDDDGDDSDDEDDDDPDALFAKTLKISKGSNVGSSSKFMTDQGKAAPSDFRSRIYNTFNPEDPRTLQLQHQWTESWSKPRTSVDIG